MSNDWKSPYSENIATEGLWYNHNTVKKKVIHFPHYGIYTNDNTYAVTFNPMMNRPETVVYEYYPQRPPHTGEHKTKPEHEPPVCISDSGKYIHQGGKVKDGPKLPPYLKRYDKPEIQGRAMEYNKGSIKYGPTQHLVTQNIIY